MELTEQSPALLRSGGSCSSRAAAACDEGGQLDDASRAKMGWSFAAAAAAVFFGSVTAHPVMAQNASNSDGPVACGNFQRGPNGSWTVLHPTTISPQGVWLNLTPGQTFAKIQFVSGIEVTTILDRNCGNQ